MTSTPPPVGSRRNASTPSRTSRTSLITIAAIAGVLVAGSAAVAANIGILNAADNSEIGELAATDELLPTPTVGTGVQAIIPTTTALDGLSAAPGAVHQYDIDAVGSVWVMTTTSGVALDHLDVGSDWTPVLSQRDLRSLRIDFTNGVRTITFTAALADDGSVTVDVTEPITVIEPGSAAPTAGSTGAVSPPPVGGGEYDDDEYDDDKYDDDEDDDDDDDDDEDEDHDEDGDEEYEYEGADDDD